jgi:selenocysteine-specific elongation factor
MTGAGEWLVLTRWWSDIQTRAGAAIRADHGLHPEQAGLALTKLRNALDAELPAPELFSALVSELCKSDFVQTGNAIRDRSHQLALPSHLQAAGSRLRVGLASKPFEPPARKELTPDPSSHQALRFLLETGEAIEVGPDLVMLTESFTQARAAVVKVLRERGQATPSDLRQLLSTSRRVIIPLLEKLDKEGVTQRSGDFRVLRGG